MNKQEKTIAILLGLCLAGWLWHSVTEQKKAAEAAREAMAAQAAAQSTTVAAKSDAAVKSDNVAAKPAEPVKSAEQTIGKVAYLKPEKLVTLSNAQEVVVLSTHGASVKSVKLLGYARDCGEISDKNPPVVLDFASAPALAAEGDFEVVGQGEDFVCFRSANMMRRVKLAGDYRLEVEEEALSSSVLPAGLSIGAMSMGGGANDLLSIDSWVPD